MDPQFLLMDEVEFELACRGLVFRGATAPVLKKTLTELLRTDQGSILELKPPGASSVESELGICSEKLNVLSAYIAELTGKPDRALFRRLVSRLYHVQGRLSLVEHETEGDKTIKELLWQQSQSLLDKLEGKDDIVEEEKLSLEDKEVLQTTLGELGEQIIQKLEGQVSTKEASTGRGVESREVLDKNVVVLSEQWDLDRGIKSRLVRSSTINEDIPKRKLVPIYQWGLKFTGGNNLSVNAFLERVSELKEARNATDGDLWRYAIDFFEGDALIWYRANKEYAESWDELVILLKRAFQKPYYQEELLAEIRARTQGSDESVLIFISVIQNMFNRLPSKVSEGEKVLIIQKNLSPYYQQAVCRDNFATVPEMINVLRIVERTKINCEGFKEPKTSINALEPDLAYKTTSDSTGSKNGGEVAAVNTTRSLGSMPVPKRCWNCRESGHMFRDCAVPKQRLFCFKCGKFGATSKDCACKGNSQGRSSSSAS